MDDLLAPLMKGAKPDLLDPAVVLKAKRDELRERVNTWCSARREALAQKLKDEMIGDDIPFISPDEYMPAA